jgi:hypothetical protein
MVAWYTATAKQAHPAWFECERCGFRREVLVTAAARGSAIITALGVDGASKAASSRAAEAVRAAATCLVRLVACPSCHARRSSAVVGTAAVQALHLLWLGPVLGGFALLADVMMGDAGTYAAAAFALGSFFAIPVVAVLVRRKLRRADASVRFADVPRGDGDRGGRAPGRG